MSTWILIGTMIASLPYLIIVVHAIEATGSSSFSTFSSSTTYDKIDPRIVGGIKSEMNRYPYYAFPAGQFLCGATLIWNDILLTAAHCLDAFIQGGILIGGNTIDGRTSTYYSIEQSKLYPHYDEETYTHDVAIIKLNGNSSGPFAQINIDNELPYIGQQVTVIGYGTTKQTGKYSTELLQVDLDTADMNVCDEYYTDQYFSSDYQLCIGGDTHHDIGQDACQGDSGGPLFIYNTDIVVGIVSFGDGCAKRGIPSVNAKMSYYHHWIETQLCHLSSYAPDALCIHRADHDEHALHPHNSDSDTIQPKSNSSTKKSSATSEQTRDHHIQDSTVSSSSNDNANNNEDNLVSMLTVPTTNTTNNTSNNNCIPLHSLCTETSSCCVDDPLLEYAHNHVQCMVPTSSSSSSDKQGNNRQLRQSKKCVIVKI